MEEDDFSDPTPGPDTETFSLETSGTLIAQAMADKERDIRLAQMGHQAGGQEEVGAGPRMLVKVRVRLGLMGAGLARLVVGYGGQGAASLGCKTGDQEEVRVPGRWLKGLTKLRLVGSWACQANWLWWTRSGKFGRH